MSLYISWDSRLVKCSYISIVIFMPSNASEGLCFAWTGEFDLLKNFVKDNLKLKGIWSQPGGDKKVFTSENCKIIWRKNKNILSVDGKRARNVLKETCKQVCTCDEFGFESSMYKDWQPSIQSVDVYDALENLKFYQSVNSEAIQALSGKILQLTSTMAQFQSFMDKNRNKKDVEQGEVIRVEQINITDEILEYGNHENSFKLNVSSDVPCALNDPLNNEISEDNASKTSVLNCDLMTVYQTPNHNDQQETYANVVASCPVLNNHKYKDSLELNGKQGDISRNCENNNSPWVPEEFIGVERKRKKIRKFLLTGIAENMKEHHILSYLE